MCYKPHCAFEDSDEIDSYYELQVEESDGPAGHEDWTVVCGWHANPDNPLIELTESTKDIPIETLTQMVGIANR